MAAHNTQPYTDRPLTSCGGEFFIVEELTALSTLQFKNGKPYFQVHTHYHVDSKCRHEKMVYIRETLLIVLKYGVKSVEEFTHPDTGMKFSRVEELPMLKIDRYLN